MHTNFWSGNLEGRGHLEDLGVDANIIIFEEIEWGQDSFGSGSGTSGRLL
jgi:hypothetical protein